jgi:hypothetical protein
VPVYINLMLTDVVGNGLKERCDVGWRLRVKGTTTRA